MQTINTITQFHRHLSLPDPFHPLVSVVHVEDIRPAASLDWERFSVGFYTVSLKKDVRSKGKYGQHEHDFDKGVMSFTAPGQLQSHVLPEDDQEIGTGYVLMLHPDFLSGHPLATAIRNYGFFSYAVYEALHLSVQEEENVTDTLKKIEQECRHIDRHTREIIIAQVEVLLNYSKRSYERQFLTREKISKDLLVQVEDALANYLGDAEALATGLPTVEYLAGLVHVTPDYVSDMLRSLTGRSAQQHIHDAVIEKAKTYLANTDLTVAEIAYQLGFQYPQSFNKLFKKRTAMTPLDFRNSFD